MLTQTVNEDNFLKPFTKTKFTSKKQVDDRGSFTSTNKYITD